MTQDSPNRQLLGSDVFISYASQDAAVANSIVENLEQQGVKCWVAPRDVKPGAPYADAIIRAINEAKAMVLVLSSSATDSSHVAREVERAAYCFLAAMSLSHAALAYIASCRPRRRRVA
jgi:nucleotide-binding universal stress UspA family protein